MPERRFLLNIRHGSEITLLGYKEGDTIGLTIDQVHDYLKSHNIYYGNVNIENTKKADARKLLNKFFR